MKIYPKTYENVFKGSLKPEILERVGTTRPTIDEYVSLYREFYRDVDVKLFDMIVKAVWLDQQFTFDGNKRMRRKANGYHPDWVYGVFMKSVVGVSSKPLTKTAVFGTIATYLKELFPDFVTNNPYENPEKYAYPFKHVSLAHMAFVHCVHNRMEMLEYAEKMAMNYTDFVNWSANQAFCYNDEVGHAVYILTHNMEFWPFLKNNDIQKEWKLLVMDFSNSAKRIAAPTLKSTSKYIDVKAWRENPVKNKRLLSKL